MSATSLATERSRCDHVHNEYKQCLNKSGRNPAKCTSSEDDLRKCSVSLGKDYCIDQTKALMNCSRSPSDSSLCADQFVAMRECNRPRGPQITKNENGVYRVVEGITQSEFRDNAGQLLAQATPPTDRSAEGLRKAAKDYAATVGISDLAEIRF